MSLTAPASPPRPTGSPSQELKALAVVLREEFDTPFRFYDTVTGELVAPGPDEPAAPGPLAERAAALDLGTEEHGKVVVLPEGGYLLALPLDGIRPSLVVAVGMVNALARTRAEISQEQVRLEKWLRSVLARLRVTRDSRDRQHRQAEQDHQSRIAWETVMGLERLHRDLRVHKEPAHNRGRVLGVAGELPGAQSLAWVSLQRDEDVVFEGERLLAPWDCSQLASLLANQPLWHESGYVLINEAREQIWGAQFPQILNLLAIPVADKKLLGWVLAFNKQGSIARGPNGREFRLPQAEKLRAQEASQTLPFRRSDAALLMPFASLIGLHMRACQRYHFLEELLVGLTRALTSAIDAKDSYTYGHSERVARAAVELGRELGLQENEQSDIYLVGLLHDIGKIGIRDDVLTKRGPLTAEEYLQVQQHPVIGHRILAGLHPIAHLLPGVLYHHERYDGGGYPEGLKGNAIPLLARIMAVADSFDAMNTSRPYRTALPPQRIDEILSQGAGVQWDPLVINAYRRCRDRLIAIRQRGLGESLNDALTGAMRNGTRGGELASIERSFLS